jgi:hypothetical protein
MTLGDPDPVAPAGLGRPARRRNATTSAANGFARLMERKA